MEQTIEFLKELVRINSELRTVEGCDIPYYRGRCKGDWNLCPTLFRDEIYNKYSGKFENILYHDFIRLCGPHTIKNLSSWEILFNMRHSGLPTRLLDWSENLFSALYFATKGEYDKPALWILNPFKMNEKYWNKEEILTIDELGVEYRESFVEGAVDKQFENPVAVYPIHHEQRIFAQKGVFTIHGTKKEPLEQIFPDYVKKIEIPEDSIEGIKVLLNLAGINEYTLFPDVDGLSRYLKMKHLG